MRVAFDSGLIVCRFGPAKASDAETTEAPRVAFLKTVVVVIGLIVGTAVGSITLSEWRRRERE